MFAVGVSHRMIMFWSAVMLLEPQGSTELFTIK